MHKVLTAPKTNDALGWDSRPFSLTLAGCLAVAGMPLNSVSTTHDAPKDPSKPERATETPCEPFRIDTVDAANWYLKKLATIEAEKARITAQTEKMLAELDSDISGLKFLYEGELQEFVRKELARKGGKKKTLHLVQATCSFRSVPASVRLADANAALEYARANGLPCIVQSERIDAETYKELAQGELLPGMETTPERETFTVKFGA